MFPIKFERRKKILKTYGKEDVTTFTLNQVFEGLNKVPSLYHATAILDDKLVNIIYLIILYYY